MKKLQQFRRVIAYWGRVTCFTYTVHIHSWKKPNTTGRFAWGSLAVLLKQSVHEKGNGLQARHMRNSYLLKGTLTIVTDWVCLLHLTLRFTTWSLTFIFKSTVTLTNKLEKRVLTAFCIYLEFNLKTHANSSRHSQITLAVVTTTIHFVGIYLDC